MPELPGLRETEARIRAALCDEVAYGIDADEVARDIAAEVVAARRRNAPCAKRSKGNLIDAEMDRVRETMAQAREERARERR